MGVLDEGAASAVAGEATGQGGLLMKGAFALRPAAVLSNWLSDAEMRSERVTRLERADGRWRLIGEADAVLGQVDAVVLAAGWGSAALLDGFNHTPRLSPVRGQADWIDGDVTIHPMAWGGYAVPTGQGVLFGATHDRGDTSAAAREADSVRNLATLEARLPELAKRITAAGPVQKRAAVRATTPDRLPVAGALDDGLYVLGGVGSRGFCVAPLLGEHIAALVLGQPSPLPRDLAARVSPRRSSVLADALASSSPTRAG
jgi:tRNA 5-methylaminomethyl-2-thiouridine biosynthesis bifunctional protein